MWRISGSALNVREPDSSLFNCGKYSKALLGQGPVGLKKQVALGLGTAALKGEGVDVGIGGFT